MKDRISQIIREEINNFLLKEAIDFSQFETYAKTLEGYVQQMSNFDLSKTPQNFQTFIQNQATQKFLYNLNYYTIQVVFALRRCAKSQNINEGFGSLSDYGIEVPREITIVNDTVNSYNRTKSFINRKRNQNANGNAETRDVDTSNVKSEKLLVLFKKVQKFQQTKNNLEYRSGISFESYGYNAPKTIIDYIYRLSQSIIS